MRLPASLLVVALMYYAPEVIVSLAGGSLAAWFLVVSHVQTAALWWIVGQMAERGPFLLATQAVCTYGIFEAAQTPICRLVFPMDRPPPKHPEGVCGAAGLPTYDLAPLLIALCAVLVARHLSSFTDARIYRI